MKRKILIGVTAALGLTLLILAIVVARQRVRRHRVFRGAPAVEQQPAIKGIPAVDQWTQTFSTLAARGEWDDLDDLLDSIEKREPQRYASWWLGYLHARALIENDEPDEARQRLAPFLRPGHPLRDLALFHEAEVEEARNEPELASRARAALLKESSSSIYRRQVIEEESDYLSSLEDPQRFIAFAQSLYAAAPTALRRDLDARLTELLLRRGATDAALQKGLTLLRGGTADDAADRAGRALDRPQVVAKMTPEQKGILGDALQNHRHFDRAVVLLRAAAAGARSEERDELLFAVGRCFYGGEKYREAMQTYLSGANTTREAKWKTTFFWHAARSAQLLGDDAAAERLMTAAIAVPGRFPATTAALTQRIRTRMKQKRFAHAASDVQLLRKIAPNDRANVDASLAYGVALLAAGQRGPALANLQPAPLHDRFDRSEFAYWRGRAREASDPRGALREYLEARNARAASHFSYFASDRVRRNGATQQELVRRDTIVAERLAKRDYAGARVAATERVLLANDAAKLQQLRAIYREIPEYRAILDLQPARLPSFPLEGKPDRGTLLMAMGLYDEAIDEIERRHPLQPRRSALTRALALNRAGASRESIYATEVLMKSVPQDFVPELLPPVVQQLLYPRYFYSYILEDAEKFGADPTLVLAIMREESRFDPRAKSEAAARGLLQFIITTARQIGRDIGLVDVTPEELYDPRVIIQLGAKYIASLSERFAGNHYKTTAAYNAGPQQVALWERLASAPGDDYFLTAINFDETKQYVRKVMNSHRRYGEVYRER